MYAVIEKGSHQYRIQPGQFIKTEKMTLAPGEIWKCELVLAFQDEAGVLTMGTPYVEKAEVIGRIIRHGKSKKSLVFKKNRRKGYRRTQGHRQEFTEIYIEAISTPNGEKMEKKLKSRQEKEIKISKKTDEESGN